MRKLMREFSTMVLCAVVVCTSGCRQTYEDPRAFLEKYLDEYIGEKAMTRAWLNSLELKGLVLENVRLEADYGTAVCATLRLVRKSDKTIYMYAPNAFYRPGKILTTEEADDCLTATVSIKRFKMDNGVFAPITKISRHDIQGYGLLGQLRVANLKEIKRQTVASIKEAKTQIDSCKDPEKLEEIFERLLSLAECRHIDYVDDKDTVQKYFEYLESCYMVGDRIRNGKRISMHFGNETLDRVNEVCKKYGLPSPRDRMMAGLKTANFDLAYLPARFLLANNDKDVHANFAAGMYHYSHNSLKEAEHHLNRCKDVNPKDVAAWNNLAMIYLKRGNLSVARNYARKAMSLAPGSAEVKDTLAQIEAAIMKR